MYWYFNLDNFRGVSMHQYSMPGFPASHACIRLLEDDAMWLYNWCDQWILSGDKIEAYGTPVIIYGQYDFKRKKPWLALIWNSHNNDVGNAELDMYVNNYKLLIIERQMQRKNVISK